METLQNDSDEKKDLDDSGCVQDAGPSSSTPADEEPKEPELLDLSDDVLLDILKYCTPRDLKAMGYTCPRLGRLILDRSLWRRVDAREQPTGRARMRWLLAHALGLNTYELLLTGYAREARGCLGHVNKKRKEVEEEQATKDSKAARQAQRNPPRAEPRRANAEPSRPASPGRDSPVQVIRVDPLSRLQRLYAQTLPRFNSSPLWPEDGPSEVDPEDVVLLDGSCPGPVFTLTQCMLRQLRAHCSLTTLALEYCNVNCNTTGINHFPPTLKKLSLRGAKCYNLPLDKSFLFNIQDYLPHLEYLDLSECEWLEPAAFLPLSKVAKLTHLTMKDCHRLSEFVAYASLATRYGFRMLKVLDVRGSPLGDSEVSALGWLPALQQLYAAPARGPPPRPPDHSHCRDERLPPHKELHAWELQEPEYFKIKPQMVEPMDTRATTSIDDIEEHIEQLRHYENNICLHGMEYNLCMEGIRKSGRRRLDPSEEAEKATVTSETTNSPTETPPQPGPSVLIKKCDDKVLFKRIDPGPSPKKKTEADQLIIEPSTSKRKMDEDSDSDDEPLVKKKPRDEASCSTSKEEPSTSSRYTPTVKPTPDDSDSSDDDIPLKRLCRNAVNDGASTSKSPARPVEVPEIIENECCRRPDLHLQDCMCKEKRYEYVRFRQNMDPVIVRRNAEEVEREERENRERENRDRANRDRERIERQRELPVEVRENANREARPRAHVLYVNVGQQLHTVYRLSIHNEPPIFYSFARNSHLRFRPNVGNIFYTPPTPHLDATSLVTDSAVRRFGRADVDDDNYIHIGPRPGVGDPGARPNRSSLRILSITGFRNITDRSLVHLATAAPHLTMIDFRGSRVTAQGVENFKSLRPECEVQFSEYVENDAD